MAKVLVLYYSSYGHMEQMANAAAEGARETGAEAMVKRVPELVPEEVARKSGFKLDQPAPVATVNELPDYDAIILGVTTRYGRMNSQIANFLDQTGGLWARGALHGKVGSVMSSTATQHGGQETTLFSGHHQPSASRPGDRRAALFVPGPDDARRDRRRLALRSHDHRGRPGPASAVAE